MNPLSPLEHVVGNMNGGIQIQQKYHSDIGGILFRFLIL